MANKSILCKNKKTLIPLDEKEDKIFHYLISKAIGNTVTISSIAKGVNIPASTVRRKVNAFIGKDYEYGSYYYRVEYVDKGFSITKEPKNPSPSQKQYIYAEKKDHRESIEEANIKELANANVLENEEAIILTSTVIFYKVKTRARTQVIRVLKNLYPDDFIHDIVPCDRGVYIILKENDYLNLTKGELQKLYKEIVNNEKIEKTRPKIPIDRKKEK